MVIIVLTVIPDITTADFCIMTGLAGEKNKIKTNKGPRNLGFFITNKIKC